MEKSDMHPTVCELSLRVRYAETDAMGIVHHRNYFVWFEAGRVEYMRRMGSNYAEIEKSGRFFAVSEVGARYLAPAHFDDLITIRTWVVEVRSRSIAFNYEVVRAATGQTLVTGFTRHICIDREGRVTAIPAQVRELLASASGHRDGM
jgi:acyl-CoA thioester hydrolase